METLERIQKTRRTRTTLQPTPRGKQNLPLSSTQPVHAVRCSALLQPPPLWTLRTCSQLAPTHGDEAPSKGKDVTRLPAGQDGRYRSPSQFARHQRPTQPGLPSRNPQEPRGKAPSRRLCLRLASRGNQAEGQRAAVQGPDPPDGKTNSLLQGAPSRATQAAPRGGGLLSPVARDQRQLGMPPEGGQVDWDPSRSGGQEPHLCVPSLQSAAAQALRPHGPARAHSLPYTTSRTQNKTHYKAQGEGHLGGSAG